MKSCLVLSHPGKREREREERKSFTFNIEYWREGFDFCLSILSQVFLRSLRASRFALRASPAPAVSIRERSLRFWGCAK